MNDDAKRILTGWQAETPEAKARWFASLAMEERARVFCEYYTLVKSLNPTIAERKDARSAEAGVRVLRKT
ncbi:MAG: hypothetical protein NTW86_05175 [Candidatus Sumerlaeota bacterium]|nr:hypothetical protein [Candidatus Sumerlaeota bacterium]